MSEKYTTRVEVMLLKDIADPQGLAIEEALRSMPEFKEVVETVRMGHFVEVDYRVGTDEAALATERRIVTAVEDGRII